MEVVGKGPDETGRRQLAPTLNKRTGNKVSWGIGGGFCAPTWPFCTRWCIYVSGVRTWQKEVILTVILTSSTVSANGAYDMRANDLEFLECDSCRAKPGNPVLCQGCLHNRRTIEELRSRLAEQKRLIDLLDGMLKLHSERTRQ
jgi:hypothetical protein